jgi:hypothetical protein
MFEQLFMGFASGLTIWALLKWTPLLRDLIAAAAAAVLIDFLISEPSRWPDVASLAGRLSTEIRAYPPFALGLALALVGIIAVIHFTREK